MTFNYQLVVATRVEVIEEVINNFIGSSTGGVFGDSVG